VIPGEYPEASIDSGSGDWNICPVCDGVEGYTDDTDEWIDCDLCGGQGGWATFADAADEVPS